MILSCLYLIDKIIRKSEQTIMRWLVLIALSLVKCEGAKIVKNNAKYEGEGPVNNRPIIGILSQELSPYLNEKYANENFTSYIAASYVKSVESSGARVVPIMINKSREYYETLMNKLNGVLLPGGASLFTNSSGYADAGKHIFNIAKGFNDAGQYFPIFGTCLGFELLIVLTANGVDKRSNCWSFKNSRLEFTKDFKNSRIFMEIPSDLVTILSQENVTINSHQFCFLDKNMKEYNLTKEWKILSHSYDEYNTKVISAVEHSKYPFYGVQFHPEKSAFEWKVSKKYASSKSAIRANRYFIDFFVDECRRSQHSFADPKEENNYVIYNYDAKFTGSIGSSYEQCYFFESNPFETMQKESIQATVHD